MPADLKIIEYAEGELPISGKVISVTQNKWGNTVVYFLSDIGELWRKTDLGKWNRLDGPTEADLPSLP